jgi:hypothetical protein
MQFYVKQILEGEDVEQFESPGTKGMFIVDDSSKALPETDRKWFHSKTTKLLYLAKRARPDILTTVFFLCTRVQGATYEDKTKMQRVLGHLKAMMLRTLYLRAHGASEITAYIDAAYTIHEDSKSHSGVVTHMGITLAYISSKKQKCMSKSPIEAELIALTDNLGLVELFQEFLELRRRVRYQSQWCTRNAMRW